MGPEKHHQRYHFRPTETPTPSVEKTKLYEVVYKGKPEKHKISITLKDNRYYADIHFSKPLTDANNFHSKGTAFSSPELDDIKSFIRIHLKRFGEYIITPLN